MTFLKGLAEMIPEVQLPTVKCLTEIRNKQIYGIILIYKLKK